MFGEHALLEYAPLLISSAALIVALTPHFPKRVKAPLPTGHAGPHDLEHVSTDFANGVEWHVDVCRICGEAVRQRA